MNYKDFEFWNREKLWELRQEIVLCSLYYHDYKNSFEIPDHVCSDFFDGFFEYCWSIEEDNGNHTIDMQYVLDKYDNAECLWDYFYGVEYPFGE